MKRHVAWSILFVALVLMLGLAVSGCSLLVKETTTSTGGAASTTTTTAAGTDAASVAANAIQAVAKSTSITTPQVLKAGTLQVGSDTAFAPMEYPDGKGNFLGFDVDLCTAIAKKLGLTLQIVPTAYENLVSSLNRGGFDMIMSALHATPALQQQIAFTDQYLPGTLAITTPVGAPVTDQAGLAGKRVGVQQDSLGQTVVAGMTGLGKVRAYNTVLEAFEDMNSGKLDAVVNDLVVDNYIVQNLTAFKGKLANSGSLATQYGYAFGAKKQNAALVSAVNAAIQELRTDGVYQKICAKWGVTGS